MKTTKNRSIYRLVLNALLVAMYYLLATLFSVELGGLKITVEALPVVLCAVIFGPADAALVGGIGEFLNQMMGRYGLMVTTPLWVLPAVVRGLFVGLCMLPVKKSCDFKDLFKGKRLLIFYATCLMSAMIVSCLNTFTLYVDSNMFGYYTYALVFGSFLYRILLGLLNTAIMATLTIPLATALRRARLI